MKLIYCNNCRDVIQLTKTTNTCQCGESGGHYKEDGLNAVIHGNCKPLGFTNSSFSYALSVQPEHGAGYKFTAFVIPKVCPTVDHVDSEDYESTDDADWLSFDADWAGVENEEHEAMMEKADADRISKRKIKNVFKDDEE